MADNVETIYLTDFRADGVHLRSSVPVQVTIYGGPSDFAVEARSSDLGINISGWTREEALRDFEECVVGFYLEYCKDPAPRAFPTAEKR